MALVFPEAAARVFSDDELFPGLVLGVSQELEAADQQLVLMMASSVASHARIERYTTAGHVDGVMLASMHGADPMPMVLQRHEIPVVVNGRAMGSSSVPYVDVDSKGGAAAAVRHLIDAGRTGIDRLAGYRSAMRAAHRRSLVALGEFTRESGAVAMRQLLAEAPDLDAVFVASDLMALGAMRALAEAGRRVPDDIAVVGFDDFELARYADPPLTTVRQPIIDLGRTLARQLLCLAAGEAIERAVVLPTSLVVRGSG
jgi:DNA-binding LacI/PurR family transcriptional regulator